VAADPVRHQVAEALQAWVSELLATIEVEADLVLPRPSVAEIEEVLRQALLETPRVGSGELKGVVGDVLFPDLPPQPPAPIPISDEDEEQARREWNWGSPGDERRRRLAEQNATDDRGKTHEPTRSQRRVPDTTVSRTTQLPHDPSWETIETRYGQVAVRPHTLEILHVHAETIVVNGAKHWLRGGPVYWDEDRWSGWEPGRGRGQEPTFTLLKSSNVYRSASLSAYTKVAIALEESLAAWLPERTAEFAVWTAACVEEGIAEQEHELARRRSQGDDRLFPDLYAIQDEYLSTLHQRLEQARTQARVWPSAAS
jgi:hypothetical protein